MASKKKSSKRKSPYDKIKILQYNVFYVWKLKSEIEEEKRLDKVKAKRKLRDARRNKNSIKERDVKKRVKAKKVPSEAFPDIKRKRDKSNISSRRLAEKLKNKSKSHKKGKTSRQKGNLNDLESKKYNDKNHPALSKKLSNDIFNDNGNMINTKDINIIANKSSNQKLKSSNDKIKNKLRSKKPKMTRNNLHDKDNLLGDTSNLNFSDSVTTKTKTDKHKQFSKAQQKYRHKQKMRKVFDHVGINKEHRK